MIPFLYSAVCHEARLSGKLNQPGKLKPNTLPIFKFSTPLSPRNTVIQETHDFPRNILLVQVGPISRLLG